MKRFAIFGASGCGRGVLPLVRQQLQVALAAGDADLVFVDDHPPAAECNGHRVLTYAEWLAQPASSRHMCVAIANSAVRQKLAVCCIADGVKFFEVRAPNVVQMDDVQLGEGDGDADASQHAVDHRRGDDEGAARHLEIAEEELHQAGTGGREADRLPTQLLHESEDDDRQAGSRTRDLQRRARQEAGDDAAGDRTDETGDHRGSGS